MGLIVRASLKSIAVVQEEVGSADLRRGPEAWNSWILIDVLILPQPRLMLQFSLCKTEESGISPEMLWGWWNCWENEWNIN